MVWYDFRKTSSYLVKVHFIYVEVSDFPVTVKDECSTNQVTWYLDGMVIGSNSPLPDMEKPMTLLINLTVGGN